MIPTLQRLCDFISYFTLGALGWIFLSVWSERDYQRDSLALWCGLGLLALVAARIVLFEIGRS